MEDMVGSSNDSQAEIDATNGILYTFRAKIAEVDSKVNKAIDKDRDDRLTFLELHFKADYYQEQKINKAYDKALKEVDALVVIQHNEKRKKATKDLLRKQWLMYTQRSYILLRNAAAKPRSKINKRERLQEVALEVRRYRRPYNKG
jgi:hypothetical protein